jgi:hypothetical protein
MRWPQVVSTKTGMRLKPPSRDEIIAAMADQPLITESPLPRQGSITSRPTTPREMFRDGLLGSIYGDDPEARHRINRLMTYADFFGAPLFGAYDAPVAIDKGQYKDAFFSGINAAAPFFGKPAKMFGAAVKGRPAVNDVIDNLPSPKAAAPIPESKLMVQPEVLAGKTPPSAKPASEPAQDGSVIRKAEDYGIYNPPDKPQRPFTSDYTNPDHIVSDASGRLLKDMEGRPLTAKKVIGRQTVGGPDVSATHSEVEEMAESISGNKIRTVPRQSIGGAYGRSYFAPVPGKPGKLDPTSIAIADDLPSPEREMITGHELAHFIDESVDQIPASGIDDELRFIYNTTVTGRETTPPRIGPDHNYAGDDIPRELMTEAIRTYLANPNWIKTVAPRTAARIREWVNTNPKLSKIVQFNSLATGMGGAALVGQNEDATATEMPEQGRNQESKFLSGLYSGFGPPIPAEPMSGVTRAGSHGIAKVADALFRHGALPQSKGAGNIAPVTQALFDIQSKRKTPIHGGPR